MCIASFTSANPINNLWRQNMQIRHTLLAAAVFTAVLAGCNKRDEAPATPAAVAPAASEPAPATSTPAPATTPAPADSGSTATPATPTPTTPADSSAGGTAGTQK
jgi:hypothetical protein